MRKFYLFFVCLVCLFCIFSLKVNASTSYITLQATYYSQYSRTLYIHSDIQVDVGGSDYGDTEEKQITKRILTADLVAMIRL